MKRLPLLGVAALAFAVACGDRTPSEPNAPAAGSPNLLIVDGAHNGNQRFWFETPISNPTGKPGYKAKPANLKLKPRVTVCRLAVPSTTVAQANNSDCAQPMIADETHPGGLDPVILDGEKYKALWHTDRAGLSAGTSTNNPIYRIKVYGSPSSAYPDAFEYLLGYADMDVISNGSFKNATTNETIPLVNGRDLPIMFRIEVGALVPAGTKEFVEATYTKSGTSTTQDVVTENKLAAVRLPGNLEIAGGATTATVIVQQIFPGQRGYPAKCATGVSVIEHPPCFLYRSNPEIRMPDEATARATPPGFIRVDFAVCLPAGAKDVRLLKSGEGEEPIFLINGPAPFITGDCPTGLSWLEPQSSNRFFARAGSGVRSLLAGLGRVVQPKSAFAEDDGRGGHVTCPPICGLPLFSTVEWVQPLQVVKGEGSGDGQSALAGTGLTSPLAVQVVTPHEYTDQTGALVTELRPVPNAKVRFEVTGGGGAITCFSSPWCATGTDGNVSATWALGTAVGTQTVRASVLATDADGNVVLDGANPVVATDLDGNAVQVSFSATATFVNPTIASVALNSTTLAIGGPQTDYTLQVLNPNAFALDGIGYQGEIIQGSASRAAGGSGIVCPNVAFEVLPAGTCTTQFTTGASNTAGGTGTLVPGPATLEIRLYRVDGETSTDLDTESVPVTLIPNSPSITSVALNSTTLAINGAGTDLTASLQNPTGTNQSVAALQGWVVQGTTRRAAGGTQTTCPSVAGGVLPPGACTMQSFASANDQPPTAGTGTFSPGAATFELQLIINSTVVDTKTVAITLISGTPSITSFALNSTSLVINGAGTDLSATLLNPSGLDKSVAVLQGWVRQGTTRRAAGGTQTTCPSAATGVLPPGICTMQSFASAMDRSPIAGTGTFAPGPATFELELKINSTVVDTKTVPITLLRGDPSITSLSLATTALTIDGEGTTYTAQVLNPRISDIGVAYPGTPVVVLQGWIRQGSARRAAGGSDIVCPPANAIGVLPPGTCTFSFSLSANNTTAAGTGTLVAGPATFELELKLQDSESETIYDTKTFAITLCASASPCITSLTLGSSTIAIGGEGSSYTANLANPTSSTVGVPDDYPRVVLQAWVVQGPLASPTAKRAAGGFVIFCGAGAGALPPGACSQSSGFSTNNTAASGFGTLVAGPATLVLDLKLQPLSGAETIYSTRTQPITLTSP